MWRAQEIDLRTLQDGRIRDAQVLGGYINFIESE